MTNHFGLRKITASICLALGTTMVVPQIATAATWAGGSENWSNPAFWDTVIVPTSTTDVFIDGGNTGIDSVVSITASSSARDVTIDLGDNINNTSTLSIFGSALLNNGTFNLNDTSRAVFRNSSMISGAGGITLGATGSQRVDIDGNNTLTIAGGSTIQGHTGSIGGNTFVGGTATLINNGSIIANGAGGTVTITDSALTNNNLLRATNSGTLVLGTALTSGIGSAIIADLGSTVIQSGVVITGEINASGDGLFRASNSASNRLTNVTLNGDLDLTTTNARERISAGGLILDGRIDIDNSAALGFDGTGALSGNAEIVFGANGNNRLSLDANGTTTLASTVEVRGENATIGGNLFVGGTQTLVNNGAIRADVNGGTFTIEDSKVTNNGILSAENGGTLVLKTEVTAGVGSSINAGAGSTVTQSAITLTGEINTTGDGLFQATTSAANRLTNVTLNGALDLTTTNARERISAGGLVLNGRIDIDNSAALGFDGTGGLSGNAEIVFGANGTNRLSFDANGTTTLASTVEVHGENATIGGNLFVGGTQTLVNNGAIRADVNGGTFTIEDSRVTNNGTLEAINGATLLLKSNVTSNPGGAIHVGAGSIVTQSAIVLIGDINTTGDGLFQATTSAANRLTNVTLNGDLDLTTTNARERISVGGLVLNGRIDIDNGAALGFDGTGALSGNGEIVFGANGTNRLSLDANGTTTLASTVEVRGENATIGGNLFVGGTQTLVNNGAIRADVDGGTFTIEDSVVDNNGTLEAINGATLVLKSNVTSNPGGAIHAGADSKVVQSAVTLIGDINTTGNGVIEVSTSAANRLIGVTVNGVMDMTLAGARERVSAGGLELNGRIDLDNGAILGFDGTGGVNGIGEIVFGATGSNQISLDANGTTTIGSDIIVRGENGTIGGNAHVGGTQNLINDGTIAADVAGGVITLTDSAVTNNGIVRVLAGATLVANSAFTNAVGGLVTGAGTIDAPTLGGGLINAGHVAPGTSPGTLTIDGDYVQTSTGVLDIEIGSLTNSDLLIVTESATLDGTLALSCFGACALDVGDSLTILDANDNELSGTFTLSLFGFGSGAFDVIYDSALGDVRLLVTEAVTAAPVPVPAALWLFISGLGLALRAKRA